MTDQELIERLRMDHPDYLTKEAADRIEKLVKERDEAITKRTIAEGLAGLAAFKIDGHSAMITLSRDQVGKRMKAEAKLTECEARLSKAVEVLQWYADFGNHVSETGEPAITFDMGGKAEDVLVELGEDIG